MDDDKNPLPSWLPWATTACLAALVACLGELWILEKARLGLMRDENLLTSAALKGAENQLEAEHILERRLRSTHGIPGGDATLEVELLLPPSTGASPGSPPWGAVAWESGTGNALLRVSGLQDAGPDAAYELWLEGTGQGYPYRCSTLAADGASGPTSFQVRPTYPVANGCRFLLILCKKEGETPAALALPEGSIVLASLPYSPKITKR